MSYAPSLVLLTRSCPRGERVHLPAHLGQSTVGQSTVDNVVYVSVLKKHTLKSTMTFCHIADN